MGGEIIIYGLARIPPLQLYLCNGNINCIYYGVIYVMRQSLACQEFIQDMITRPQLDNESGHAIAGLISETTQREILPQRLEIPG